MYRSRELLAGQQGGWKSKNKEGPEQHNIHQGKLAFEEVAHLCQMRALGEGERYQKQSRSFKCDRTCVLLRYGGAIRGITLPLE
jgi:hypothetical protein